MSQSRFPEKRKKQKAGNVMFYFYEAVQVVLGCNEILA
jgi:hypothetical protein